MAKTGIVKFRVQEANVSALRAHGMNPNEFARRAFENAYRELRANEKAKPTER